MVAVVLAAILAGGCASNPVPPPQDAISEAQEAIERARQANAYEFSALEMTKSERKLEQAKQRSASEDDEDRIQARRLAEQAKAEARLAEAKARLADARGVYGQAKQTVDALRQELGVREPQGSEGAQ
jgi:hypothetical protein